MQLLVVHVVRLSYRLAAGTGTDILLHFPANFSSWLNGILRLSITSNLIVFSFSNLSSGTWSLRCTVSQPALKEIVSVVGSRENLNKSMKYPQR